MSNLSAFVAVLLTILAARTTLAQQPPAQSSQQTGATPQSTGSMRSFASAEGLFKVDLPGTPQQAAKPLNLQGGGTSMLHQFWVDLDSDDVTYMVIYNDYPSDYASASPQELLQTMRDGVVRDKTLTSDVPIELFGVPGRAFTAIDKDGWQYAVHQFLDGIRLYQLIVVNNEKHPAYFTEQFMNSFRILASPSGAGASPPSPPAQ
jgi:hypothetical protein